MTHAQGRPTPGKAPAPPLPDTEDTRREIIETCLWMGREGINQGTSGNVSARVEGGILITPSGVAYERMTPEMIVSLPLDGTPGPAGSLRPSTEWRFHQALHAARPDMPVVLHAHPPHCTALAVQRRPIPPCHYMVAAFGGGDVPVADYALFGSEDLARAMARVLAERHGCLMANHGATVLGESFARARWRLQELEALARICLLGQLGGAPVLLTETEIAEALAAIDSYGQR